MTGVEIAEAIKAARDGYRKTLPYLGEALTFWRYRRARLALKRLLRRDETPKWRWRK